MILLMKAPLAERPRLGSWAGSLSEEVIHSHMQSEHGIGPAWAFRYIFGSFSAVLDEVLVNFVWIGVSTEVSHVIVAYHDS